MIVHWENGKRSHVSADQWARASVLADLCPGRAEHTSLPGPKARRRMRVEIHQPCGLPVVWRSKT